jgi:type IV/VI secretion system ImpK/VasF family protein
MSSVHELFADLFAYVLLFDQATLEGESQPSYEQVRGEIVALLEKGKATARQERIPEAEFQEACFAVVAWADEVILRRTTWKHHNDWNAFPLQQEYFQTRRAGEDLFAHLRELSNDQKDVRETYYLCLGLGFNGQYFRDTDEPRLSQLRHEQARRLLRPVESVHSIDKITPQPYTIAAPVGKPVTDLWSRWLVKVGYALLIGVPLVLLLVYLLGRSPVQFLLTVTKGGNGSGIVTSSPEGVRCGAACTHTYASGSVVTLQALPDPGSVFSGWRGDPACREPTLTMATNLTCSAIFTLDAQAIRAMLSQYQCAKIAVTLDGSTVELRGAVKSEEQRTEILASVGGLKGVTGVKDALRSIPAYFCEVFALLDPLQRHGEKQGFGLQARLDHAGEIPIYVSQDNLVVTGTVPTKFQSYVYVDYYTAGGNVAHLLPNEVAKSNLQAAGQQFTIGEKNSANAWLIGDEPPFGIELVTVLVSKTQLFPKLRGDVEPTVPYLRDLRQVLPAVTPSAEFAAILLLLETKPAR